MLRNLIYISQAKLDMLIPQIPAETKSKLAVELGVNVGVFSAKIASESDEIDNVISSLLAVERYIESEGLVTTLESPKEWVKGIVDMQHISLEENPSMFLLIGEHNETLLLLAGSASHIVGTAIPETVKIGASYLPFLAKALQKALSEFEGMSDEKVRLLTDSFGGLAARSGIHKDELASMIYNLWQYSSGFEQKVCFLGRQLFSYERPDEKKCSIISPLYVEIMTSTD